jgi:hypothetical protein
MRQTITVDFDNVLAFESVQNTGWIVLGTGVLKPIKAIHDLIRQKHREGFDIHCVTFRETKDLEEVRAFIKEHNLPIKEVHNTSSKSKTPILKKLNSTLHIDDSLSVCLGAIAENIDVLFVDFGQLKDDSQKELAISLDRIILQLD